MNWFITGATGFVGTHLVALLERTQPDAVITGTTLHPVHANGSAQYHVCDLLNADATRALVQQQRPACVVHLAGQANIDASFRDPWGTFETNVRPLLHLLDACRALPAVPRVLVVTSAEIYGHAQAKHMPLDEQTPLCPANPYSVSKAAQDLLAQQYSLSYQMPIVRARPFNHIGPGQRDSFVATAFAMQIARIEAGLQPPQIRVGNLQSQRDFTDVRDIVRAYVALAQSGMPGDAYNVASGRSITIATLLQELLRLTSVSVEVVVDAQRLRPVDLPVLSASCEKLHQATGWQPVIPLHETLANVLDDCRQRVRASTQGA